LLNIIEKAAVAVNRAYDILDGKSVCIYKYRAKVRNILPYIASCIGPLASKAPKFYLPGFVFNGSSTTLPER